MTLLITVFLVLINIFNTIQTNSPKVITARIREGGKLNLVKTIIDRNGLANSVVDVC